MNWAQWVRMQGLPFAIFALLCTEGKKMTEPLWESTQDLTPT